MSTATPAPEQAAAEQPFNPLDFPEDLRAARLRANALYAAQNALQARLPWSREPMPGWEPKTNTNTGEVTVPGREASPGWDPADAAEYDRIAEELREVTAVIQTHPWWSECRAHGVTGPAIVEARQALKSLEGTA
ncbi:hypothetical protein ACWDXD_24795 [Streptomyces sp. NPDC003314]